MTNTNFFLEQDNFSFSKILMSREIADIIKQILLESTNTVHSNSNVRENFKVVQHEQ